MKKIVLFITLYYGFLNMLYSQEAAPENGIVSFSLPIRNSLKFNRHLINPTFSFVRTQNATISFYNKRQWVQFENAPQTYFFNYSGRFGENEAFALGLFQQNYGLMTVFGGVVNFAHNIVLQEDSNLTFGVNVGAYQSKLDQGKIISDVPLDVSNYPSNTLLTINPGINYGTTFLDFGLSVNNLILYNLDSGIIKEDPERAIEIHVMYTGFIDSYGFFDKSNFSGIVKAELKKDKTVFSGLALLSLQQGFWVQGGYNTLYGISGGLGANISPRIAIEYNYEKGTGNFTNLGASHEFVIAYKFKNRNDYYGEVEEEGALIKPSKPTRSVKAKTSITPTAKISSAEKAKLAAEAKAKSDAETAAKTKLSPEAKAKADAKADAENAAKLKAEQERQARLIAEIKAKAEQERKIKLAAAAKAKADAEAAAELKAEQDRQIQLIADAKTKADVEAAARLKTEEETRQLQITEEARQARLAADARAIAAAKAAATLKDGTAKTIDNLTQTLEKSGKVQTALIAQFNETVASKQNDLDDLREENDLSEKGVYKEPKPFKSVATENNQLEVLKSQVAEINKKQKDEINKLSNSYKERLKKVPNKEDAFNKAYLEKINQLKAAQLKAEQESAISIANLERIKKETEIEKKRRIKRAAYQNDHGRYIQGVAALKRIKETTKLSNTPLTENDFDFGEDQVDMQIIKNVKNFDSGYYLIIAVHNSVEKRDEFLTKVVASGRVDVNFFYNITTSKYYIYYDKFDDFSEAQKALETKGNKPYNAKMAIVKVENE